VQKLAVWNLETVGDKYSRGGRIVDKRSGEKGETGDCCLSGRVDAEKKNGKMREGREE
jgi:hypothetical protein